VHDVPAQGAVARARDSSAPEPLTGTILLSDESKENFRRMQL
jgi:hypothetical protein